MKIGSGSRFLCAGERETSKGKTISSGDRGFDQTASIQSPLECTTSMHPPRPQVPTVVATVQARIDRCGESIMAIVGKCRIGDVFDSRKAPYPMQTVE